MPVEPRISANSSVTGISAPVTPLSWNWRMQKLQIDGLPEYLLNPKCRRTPPPTPPNGAQHILQRGVLGTCRIR